MLAQLATVKSRLALVVTDYDDLLTNAIKAVSARFDNECNRTLARTVGIAHEFDSNDTESCHPVIRSNPSPNSNSNPTKPTAGPSKPASNI